ncbi:hypothetical protein AAHH78_34910, partial [Burkholderia pseudomallei]
LEFGDVEVWVFGVALHVGLVWDLIVVLVMIELVGALVTVLFVGLGLAIWFVVEGVVGVGRFQDWFRCARGFEIAVGFVR